MKNFLTQINQKIKKFLASIVIYPLSKFIFLILVGIMIAYIMSLPLGLLDILWRLFPPILNVAWRLLLILLCFMSVAIILDSLFNSDKDI